MITLDDMTLALQELKGWKGLPYCIEEPMGTEGTAVVIKDLFDNLIELVEFVENLPSALEEYKEKESSITSDSNVIDHAINAGIDRAITHVNEFVNHFENPEILIIEEPDYER